MSDYQSSKKKYFSILICILLLLSIGLAAFIIRNHHSGISNNLPADDGQMDEDIARLSEEIYESLLLSMHSSQHFTEEDFLKYLNQNTLVASHTLLNTRELSQYLDCALQSGNQISHVYLCLDPELLWETVGGKNAEWTTSLTSHLYSYIENNPTISFEVLLPYPYIDYWLALSSEKLNSLLAVYHTFINDLSVYPNTTVFFPGSEYWLMVNRANYEDTLFDANDIITQKVFLLTFCDALYQITPQNEDAFWNTLREIVDREKETPTYYPDLSDWCLVFFGDSIFGNFSGSYSIPGYISGLSNATTYNCAAGGSSASLRVMGYFDFPSVIDTYLNEDKLILNDNTIFYPNDFQADEFQGKELCFIINFGINDYLSGCPIENPSNAFDIATYKGSLRSCIDSLQQKFPEAYYIVMSPTHLGLSRDTSEENAPPLTAYIEALRDVSLEMNLNFIDNYNDFVITEENLWDYLPDGCHPSEKGRLAIAVKIMEFIESALK